MKKIKATITSFFIRNEPIVKLILEIIIYNIKNPIHRIDFLYHQKELEITQIMFELIMTGVDLPKQNSEVDFLDAARMLKIRTESTQQNTNSNELNKIQS